jgi:hypothetical protein
MANKDKAPKPRDKAAPKPKPKKDQSGSSKSPFKEPQMQSFLGGEGRPRGEKRFDES